MRVMGAAAISADAVVHELESAAFTGRPALVWCDGQDLVGVFCDTGENVADLLRVAPKVVPLELPQ